MDDDRIEGSARRVGGQAEEEIGRVPRALQTRAAGIADRAADTAQALYGQTADAVRDTAVSFDKWLRTTISTQPYTSALVAAAIGWPLGGSHRPL